MAPLAGVDAAPCAERRRRAPHRAVALSRRLVAAGPGRAKRKGSMPPGFAGAAALITYVLIAFLNERKGGIEPGPAQRRDRLQVGPVQLGKGFDTEQAQTALGFVLEQLEHAHHALDPRGGGGQALQPANTDGIGPKRHGLDDIGAAHETAIDDDLGAAGHGVDHLGQDREPALAMVELTATVVGNIDALDAVLDREPRILGGGDTLEDDGNWELAFDARHVGPGEAGLKLLRGGAPTGGGQVAFGDVALAPAIVVKIDGEAQSQVAMG